MQVLHKHCDYIASSLEVVGSGSNEPVYCQQQTKKQNETKQPPPQRPPPPQKKKKKKNTHPLRKTIRSYIILCGVYDNEDQMFTILTWVFTHVLITRFEK